MSGVKRSDDTGEKRTPRCLAAVTTELRAAKLMKGLQALARDQPELDLDMEPGSAQLTFFNLLNTEPYGRGPAAAKKHFTKHLHAMPRWKLCFLRGIMKAHKKDRDAWPELEEQWGGTQKRKEKDTT
jgi:hypothetical protein